MATHVFEAKDGERIERWYSMTRKSPPPKRIKVGGKTYVRQYGTGATKPLVERNYHVVAYQFDESDAKVARSMGIKTDEDDFPVLTSKKQIRDFAHKMNEREKGRTNFQYDFGIHNG